MNWLLEVRDPEPVVLPIDESQADVGPQKCGCCFVYATRKEAKTHELSVLRGWQHHIQAELADCENRIVTVMRELGITNSNDSRRV